MSDKLRRCPFCGRLPVVKQSDKTGSFVISCYNDNCKILPETFPRKSLREAKRDWNCRRGENRG